MSSESFTSVASITVFSKHSLAIPVRGSISSTSALSSFLSSLATKITSPARAASPLASAFFVPAAAGFVLVVAALAVAFLLDRVVLRVGPTFSLLLSSLVTVRDLVVPALPLLRVPAPRPVRFCSPRADGFPLLPPRLIPLPSSTRRVRIMSDFVPVVDSLSSSDRPLFLRRISSVTSPTSSHE